MPNKIKPKRSYTANSVPLTTDLETNELAIRWDASSPAIFTKNASGQIVTVALGGSGGGGSSSLVTAATVAGFPATGSTANVYVATDTNRIYRWDATNSIYVELGPLASSGDTLLRSYLVPTAPTGVVATAGNAQVSLTWTAATSLSQIPVTDYLIQSSTDNGTTWALASDTVSTATSATITGLTNGTAYTFRVAAVNGVGTGAYSTASSAVTPGAGDPYFSNVSLLLHMDGSNGSKTFTDSGPLGLTPTVLGQSAISTTQSKFGGSSGLFTGSGAVTYPLGSHFAFGTDPFAVEFWFRPMSLSGTSVLSFGWTQGNGPLLFYREGGNLVFYSSTDSSSWNVASNVFVSSVSVDTWYWIVAARSGGAIRIYVNGTLRATVTTSASLPTPPGPLAVGGRTDGQYGWPGFVDELRITKGSDRGYTGASIPVPTAPFPDA